MPCARPPRRGRRRASCTVRAPSSTGSSSSGSAPEVPITPWDWSFDLSEDQAAALLAGCPAEAVLIVHSPPRGHVDRSGAGDHLGSTAILGAIESKRPSLAICGHIHESWGAESELGPTRIVNLGPSGTWFDL